MKHIGGIMIAAALVAAAASGPAAAVPASAVSTAKTATVEALPADIKLSATQLTNFVTAYCINVAAHGEATTRTLFEQVVSDDQISAAQASFIENAAAATC